MGARWWSAPGMAALLALSACSGVPGGAPPPTTAAPQVRLLATVYASPTPGAEAQRATQIAARPTLDARQPTPVPSATVYVGVFLGAEQADGGVPVVDAARYQGTLAALGPTLGAPAPGAACAVPIDPVFGAAWTANNLAQTTLRCPLEPVRSDVGTTQVFERGAMYFLPGGEIWAIVAGGSAGGPYWYVRQAPADPGGGAPPPEGLRVPSLGFGAVWRGVAGVQQALGYARTDESSASITRQRFEGGTLLLDSSAGQVFVLVGPIEGGTAYGPY